MKLLNLLLLTLYSGSAIAAPVVEKLDRVELNWTTFKIRFHGESELKSGKFIEAEKAAIQNGLSYIYSQIPEIRKKSFKPLKLDGDHDQAALELTKRTYPIQTNLDKEGKIMVELESSLVTALKPLVDHKESTKHESDAQSAHSGIVIKINGDFIPKPVYKLVNEKGDLLYSHQDVLEEAFEKNFMGKFVKGFSKYEVQSLVGSKPLVIDATVDAGGSLKVNNSIWNEVIRVDSSLIREAKILLVL